MAIDVAMANPLGSVKPTSLVLTGEGLLAVTSVGVSAVVTVIAPDQIERMQSSTGVLMLGFLDTDRHVDRSVMFDFREHGERDGFINKVVDAMVPSFERRVSLSSKGWVQEWLPLNDEDETACGMATIQLFGSALVAVIEPGDHLSGRQSRDRHVYPWSISFRSCFVDREEGTIYLKFSSGGVGIMFKTDRLDEWAEVLDAHALPVDSSLTKEDWRVHLA